jgi:hypothetical protein
MNKNVLLALIAGLLGGLLTRYLSPPPAFAQNQARVAKEIRAQSFTLVDQTDQTAGTFSIVPGVPGSPINRTRIVLRDSTGREIWSAGGTGLQPLTEK